MLTLTGLGIFWWAGHRRSREGLLFSAPFTLTALALFWLPLLETPTVYWADLVAILVLLAQREIARRMPDRYPLRPEWQATVIVVGGLSLWLFVSRCVLEQASGFYLTASWSLLALALFTCGILLRERVYRWVGLGLLWLCRWPGSSSLTFGSWNLVPDPELYGLWVSSCWCWASSTTSTRKRLGVAVNTLSEGPPCPGGKPLLETQGINDQVFIRTLSSSAAGNHPSAPRFDAEVMLARLSSVLMPTRLSPSTV